MLKSLFLLSLYFHFLFSQELLVIGDKSFVNQNLTKSEIKAIFLDKKRFIGASKILAMNYESHHPLRSCFEKNILEKSERSLEKYWRKAYYKGKRPPKIISSEEMLFLYLESVQPSIGYIDFNSSIGKEVTVLYRLECENNL